MSFKKLLDLFEKGEDLMSPLSGIIGDASGILNMLGVGRRRKIREQKEMAEALKAEAGKNKEETTSIIEKRIWQVKQEMFVVSVHYHECLITFDSKVSVCSVYICHVINPCYRFTCCCFCF